LSVDESGLVSELPAGRFENFHIQSVVSWAGGWYIGGELLDHCLDRGVAAVYRVMGENSKNLVWTDETPFRSYLRGMVVADGKLVVAVNEERAIRISKADMNLSKGYN